MVSQDISTALQSKLQMDRKQPLQQARQYLATAMMWLCLLLACSGTGWFAYQYFLVPQPRSYTPDWQQANWIQPTDIASPTAYFRYGLALNSLPDNAFVTITANQVFQLYVNGFLIGSNVQDFLPENTPRAYMYDIDSVLNKGSNIVGIRVVDVDQQKPALRANIGIVAGSHTYYYGTNDQWQATGQATLVHTRNQATQFTWATSAFDARTWKPATSAPQPSGNRLLTVNPVVYTYPLSTHWITPGVSQESYYVHQINVPANFGTAYIRLVASGKADIFINDHEYMKWDGQVPAPQYNIVTYLNGHDHAAPYRNGLLMGMYDITPFLHGGTNTIAVHVQSPGNTTAKVGLDSHKSAMSMDLLVGKDNTYNNVLASDAGWHAASFPVAGWTQASQDALQWAQPFPIGRPGTNRSYYIPDSTSPHNTSEVPPVLMAEVLLYSSCAVLLAWLAVALFVLGRFLRQRRLAYQTGSLVFLPALAFEGLLLVLSREALIPQPFPYTGFWAIVLIALVVLSAAGLWYLGYRKYRQNQLHLRDLVNIEQSEAAQSLAIMQADTIKIKRSAVKQTRWTVVKAWLRQHWGLIVIMLLAIPMASYGLNYEPFWQDELSSYYAAIYIMQHGYPAFVSGFIYPKGELFSYTLALLMSIFGTGGQIVPRTIALSEYLVSLPLFYFFMQKFFPRRIILFATALLAFSPYALIWSRQVRMYEQAQFMVILVMFTLYNALRQPDKKRLTVIALICLVLAYFSHEENFIILPAALVCSLIATREGYFGIPVILRKKHWWQAALIATSLVLIQLMVVYWSHPPTFATDQSRRPQITLTTDNLPYYIRLFFGTTFVKQGAAPWGLLQPWIGVTSALMLLGCILAFCQKSKPIRFYASFLLISTATLMFLFTMEADRYYYPLLPLYYLMASYAFWRVIEAIWRFARPRLARLTVLSQGQQGAYPQLPRSLQFVVRGGVSLLCLSILLAPALPISNYNLFVSRVLGLNYRHHFADYNSVGQYMQAHMQKGDVVLTISPAVTSVYYIGHVDDYLSVNRALFLFESDGQIHETTSGAHPIFNQSELNNILASHARVWIITDNGNYQAGAVRTGFFTFPLPDFRMVYEGYGSAIYARSLDG